MRRKGSGDEQQLEQTQSQSGVLGAPVTAAQCDPDEDGCCGDDEDRRRQPEDQRDAGNADEFGGLGGDVR